MCVCTHECMCLLRPVEGIRFPKSVGTGGYKFPIMSAEIELLSSEKPQMLLITWPSLLSVSSDFIA